MYLYFLSVFLSVFVPVLLSSVFAPVFVSVFVQKCAGFSEQVWAVWVQKCEQRSISRASGARPQHRVETGVNQPLTLYSAKYWILNEGSALGPIYKAWPCRAVVATRLACPISSNTWQLHVECPAISTLGMSCNFLHLECPAIFTSSSRVTCIFTISGSPPFLVKPKKSHFG